MKKVKGKQSRTLTKIVFSVTVIFCIVSIIFIIWLVKNNERNFIKNYDNQQQLLVDMAVDKIKTAVETEQDADKINEIIISILKKEYMSGNRYWIAARDTDLIYVENDEITEDYKGRKLHEVISDDAVVSIKNFQSQGHVYSVLMSTNTEYALSTGGVDSHNIYLFLYIVVTLILYLSSITLISLKNEDLSEHIREDDLVIKEKNRMIETLSTAAFNSDIKDGIYFEKADIENDIRNDNNNSYRFKFYINASHSIYINGKLGEKHPHTWEVSLVVVQNVDIFVRFKRIEEIIEKFFSRYQNAYINEIEPFNKINPTLENITRYFNTEINSIAKKIGWNLEKIEVSETPSRSYIINNNE